MIALVLNYSQPWTNDCLEGMYLYPAQIQKKHTSSTRIDLGALSSGRPCNVSTPQVGDEMLSPEKKHKIPAGNIRLDLKKLRNLKCFEKNCVNTGIS